MHVYIYARARVVVVYSAPHYCRVDVWLIGSAAAAAAAAAACAQTAEMTPKQTLDVTAAAGAAVSKKEET